MAHFLLPPDRRLYWIQPRVLERRYVLVEDQEAGAQESEYASLQFVARSFERAEARAGQAGWIFQRQGCLNSALSVRRLGEQVTLAVYRLNLMGLEGRLVLNGGQAYRWQPANLGRVDYRYLYGYGQPLVVFHPGAPEAQASNLFKIQYQVQISASAYSLADLPLLLTFGWFLVVRHQAASTQIG